MIMWVDIWGGGLCHILNDFIIIYILLGGCLGLNDDVYRYVLFLQRLLLLYQLA